MNVLATVSIAILPFAVAYCLFALYAADSFFRRARRSREATLPPESYPPVTLLKPLRGPGVGLYKNLASFCSLDYPAPVQIVLGVADPADPAVEVARRLRRDFPECDITLVVDPRPLGTNRKVANLHNMAAHAKHDILVISDSDIRVRPDYLRSLVAPLADPEVGLVTCLYRGAPALGWPTVVESLLINTDYLVKVLVAQRVEPLRYAFGASIAIRRAALERIGGFAAIADYLADDYLLGNRVAAAGYRVALSPHVVETVLDSRTWRDLLRHQIRWGRTHRTCRPSGYFFTVLTQPTLWATLYLLASGFSTRAWAAWVLAVGVRMATLGVLFERYIPDPVTRRRLWSLPAIDLLASVLWAAAFLGRRVEWAGESYTVHLDGRMTPLPQVAGELASAPAPRPAHPPLDGRLEPWDRS